MIRRALSRRTFGRHLATAAGLMALPSATRAAGLPVHGPDAGAIPGVFDIEGHLPPLDFRMERVSDGRTVTARDYRGDAVIVYFGFTRCPDTCPLTALNAARLFGMLGKAKEKTRFLFVTVDLAYDTPARLKQYLAQFGPPPYIDGLHGTPAQLHAFARRYAVFYKAPTGPGTPDPESAIRHSDAVYLFGPFGKALALINDFGDANPHLPALAKRISEIV